MTDTQLETALRPIVAAALKAQGITPRSTGDDERQPYQPSDLPRFHDYYGASADGTYPGLIHTFFSTSPRAFSRATGSRTGKRRGSDHFAGGRRF